MASRLNALHTLPAALKPATSFWGKGKSLVAFYKAGIMNVWQNRKDTKGIKAKYNVRNGFDLSQSILENTHLARIEHDVRRTERARQPVVTRSELLTLVRTDRDLRKLPFFVVIFAICFEMTPIVLWGFPRIAPSTCWSASFNRKLRATYRRERGALAQTGASLDGSESVFRLGSSQLRGLAAVLDFGHHYRVLPRALLAQRVLKHITLVRADDILLRQNEDRLQDLDHEELVRALMDRALPLEGGLDALKYWIHHFKEPMDAGFFIKNNAPGQKTLEGAVSGASSLASADKKTAS